MTRISEFLGRFEGVTTEPIKGLLELTGISKNPIVQLALALVAIFAAVVIIKTIQIDAEFPIKSIIIMLILMMIVFVFSALTKTKDIIIKVAGYILMYTVVLSTSFLAIASVSAIAFGQPETLARILANSLSLQSIVKLPSENKLEILGMEFCEMPGFSKASVTLKAKSPAFYKKNENIMFLAKINGFKYDEQGIVDIQFECSLVNITSRRTIKQCPSVRRTYKDEWLTLAKAKSISVPSIERIVGVLDTNSMAFSNLIIPDEPLDPGSYIVRLVVRDNLANQMAERDIPLYVKPQ